MRRSAGKRSSIRRDSMVAIAMIGTCEFTPMLVGRIDPSTTKRPGSSNDSPA
ncbi:hypothetical protein D3C83_134540 [compost metagenome]